MSIPRKTQVTAKISQIDLEGTVTIRFNAAMVEVKNASTIDSSVLELKLRENAVEKDHRRGFTWRAVSFSWDKMVLKLEFD
jgi:hypothetical protein